MDNEILDLVKSALRLGHSKFDETVLVPLIQACRWDLVASGVNQEAALYGAHPLINQAIIFYARSNFETGADPREIQRNADAYEHLKKSLALMGDLLNERGNKPNPSDRSPRRFRGL